MLMAHSDRAAAALARGIRPPRPVRSAGGVALARSEPSHPEFPPQNFFLNFLTSPTHQKFYLFLRRTRPSIS